MKKFWMQVPIQIRCAAFTSVNIGVLGADSFPKLLNCALTTLNSIPPRSVHLSSIRLSSLNFFSLSPSFLPISFPLHTSLRLLSSPLLPSAPLPRLFLRNPPSFSKPTSESRLNENPP